MVKLKIFCVTNKLVPALENSNYILGGVGKSNFNNYYLRSDHGINIFEKEKYYSELTFHYWYWKNLLKNEDAEWVGFCQRRRLWVKDTSSIEKINFENIKDYLLISPDETWKNYDAILCKPISIIGAKKIKILKRGWKNLLKNPALLFNPNLENIKLHFDMHHGHGNLEKAIKLISKENSINFLNFVKMESSFNPHIMFIAKKKLVEQWFNELFPWLERCEKIFGFEKLEGYDTTRLYAYLAERYLSYWFQKYTNYKFHPWIFMKNF